MLAPCCEWDIRFGLTRAHSRNGATQQRRCGDAGPQMGRVEGLSIGGTWGRSLTEAALPGIVRGRRPGLQVHDDESGRGALMQGTGKKTRSMQ